MFEGSGAEEGDFERTHENMSARTHFLQSLTNYSPLVAYFFTVNYILGVGCLGIPYAFQSSGVVLASILIIVVSCVSYITVMFVAEASHRGMQIQNDRKSKNPFRSPIFTQTSKRRSPLPRVSPARSSSGKFLSQISVATSSESKALVPGGTRQEYTYSALELTDIEHSSNGHNSSTLNLTQEGRNGSTGVSVTKNDQRGRARSIDSTDDTTEGPQEMDVADLTSEFLGVWGKVMYQVSLIMLTFIGN